ncbi:MAG: diguanylate cyclase, partial [Verrucomicrobia bacterium]|nr:diguanylate cyclase [Verrucomicrobiota bacterium]
MQLFFPTVALLSDLLPGALGVVGAVVVSFVVITLISSYYRFQHIVQQAESTQPEEMGATAIDILRVQLARYLAGCARRGTSFSISLIQLNDASLAVHMDSPVITAIKEAARHDDVVCVYDQHTAALLMEVEPEDSEAILRRITDTVSGNLPASVGELLRVGIASYPGHGLSGKNLLEVANEGLAQSDADRPIVLPEIVDEDEEMPEEAGETMGEENRVEVESVAETESKSRRQRRKRGMLDELTGVLKPSAVSAYMQRMMSDLRYKKKKAALFCIGVNNMEHIARFHGQEAADDVLAGVSKILQENLRADDLIGRHEKYAFLALVQTSLDEAEIVGKRISTLVQQNQMTSGSKKIKVTITLGVAA